MALKESGEMYLETILVLSKQKSCVRAIDIGEHMGYSKPSISRAMGLLKKGGYVVVDENGYISLTPSGLAVAEKILQRHALLTKWLVSLGVDQAIATQDACKMEHHISDESFQAIKHYLEQTQN
ncbi:MAG: metal-dependent transcriptional regulator [Clostridia bacterium]|nr:metal-dependent transcriptional regulator [Clostridia bacterium]